MAIDFPASPTLNETFTVGGVTYTWDGTVWVTSGSAAFATANQGALADSAVQPEDLATVATSGSYNDLADQPTIPTNNNQLTNGAGYLSSPLNNDLEILGASPRVYFNDTNGYSHWAYVDSNNFYILTDRTSDGAWDSPHALQLESDTNDAYVYGRRIIDNGQFSVNSTGYFQGNLTSAAITYMNTGSTIGRGAGSDQNVGFTLDAGGCYIVGNSSSSNPKNLFIQQGRPGQHIYFQTAFSTSTPEQKNRLQISNGGDVYFLDQTGSGTVTAQLTASGRIIRQSSDRNLKERITDLPSMTDTVKNLRPCSFYWKDSVELGPQEQYGFIAQEVQTAIPSAVTIHAAGEDRPEIYGLNTDHIIAALTKALQESIERIEALEAEVADLKGA